MSEHRVPLTVLSVAYPLLPVNSGSGGGAEQILHLVERGLASSGARSIVIAAKGSQLSGSIIETAVCEGPFTEERREQAQQKHRKAIHSVLKREKVDVIHFHGLDFDRYVAEETHAAQLATLHLPVSWYPSRVFELPNVSLNCVSQSQASSASVSFTLPVISNGVDVSSYRASMDRTDSLLWLGRVCPEKGTDVALRVAHRLKLPLTVAGPVHPFETHERYFTEQVQPLLDDQRRYIGTVGLQEKAALLTQARCVLIPSLAPETSSLVAMEAASSGAPVIAYRSGALPEVVEDGITGFIVDSEEDMADAVRRSREISPAKCLAVAQTRFQASRMVADYIALYRQLINDHRSHAR